MKIIKIIFFLLISLCAFAQEADIWVLSNIKLTKSDKEVDQILKDPKYSLDDILIFHGNALKKTKEEKINSKIKDLRSKFDRVYIIPGRADWNELRAKDLKAIGDYLDDEYKGDVIVPENSCGNLEIKELSDDLALVFMDSDWYFNDWTNDREFNKDCEITSRSSFWLDVKGTLGKLKAKQVLLFARAPILRNDNLGGHLNLKDHLLPLPLIGTMINDTRNYLTPRENILSPIYQDYINNMKSIVENHPKMTLITSDSKLNSIYNIENNYQININSSKKMTGDHADSDLIFQNTTPSFLHLSVENNNITAELLDSKSGKKMYSQIIISGIPFEYDSVAFSGFSESTLDRKVKRKIRLDEDKIRLNSFIFGSLNTTLYSEEVEVEQLNLATMKGGLKPLRLGGGNQTRSLRLIDNEGQIYLARSLKKRPEKSLPPNLDFEPIEKTVDYYFMAADPLAFLTTPILDRAANVYHTTPQLMHLSRQPALSIYNDEIGDELVIFRERADEAWPNKESFGYSKNIISSSSMIEEIAENRADVDANMFLRARLLDLVIGDWDRHMDQWRWAQGNDENSETYFPIARDRDQVYANFNGAAIAMVRPYTIDVLQMRKFDDDLTKDDIRWMHWKSAILDNFVLTELSKEEWETQTDFIKSAITPEIIKEATDVLPLGYANQKKNIRNNVNKRMEFIDEISKDFRSELLQKVIVRGSNERDSIIIEQQDNVISITLLLDYQDSKKKVKKYDYQVGETEEIWIYGLEKDDVFSLVGDDDSDIRIKLIGGYGDDIYRSLTKYKNATIIDDEPKELVKKTTKTQYKYTESKLVHDLNRYDLIPMHKFLMPNLAFNTDDGLLFGGSYNWVETGFKTKTSQAISASFLTRRKSSLLSYSYMKDDLLERKSTFLNADWSGIRRQLNFHGGNGTTIIDDRRFYEVWLSDARLELGKTKQINNVTSTYGSVYAWSAKVENVDDQFVSQAAAVNPEIFERENFVGAKAGIVLQNSNSPMRPTQLARIKLSVDYKYATQSDRSNFSFDFEYDYYRPLIGNDRLLFSTKLKAGHLFGEYFLYEGYQIGGTEYLRGFRNGRFTGRSMIVQNTNLQLKLFNRVLGDGFKCSAGVSGGFDHGRTWSEFDESDDWQYSYGGGIWISPLDIAVFSTGIYQAANTDEGFQIRIKFGWQF